VELIVIRLSLLRHAKSDWDTDAASDYKRPLSQRGKTSAPLMGDYIRSKSYIPDLVYCSAALRTRETFKLAFPDRENRPSVCFEENLYLADPNRILHMARTSDSQSPNSVLSTLESPPLSTSANTKAVTHPLSPDHIMFIGHNPGLQSFALGMMTNKISKNVRFQDAKKRIKTKFATAAFVLIEFETELWAETAPGTGTLLDYMTPKLLAGLAT